MELHEIENLSATEIKEQRAQLIEDAKAAPVDQLASRYMQARLDAKTRDEKLAEQGKTITLLQQALEKASADHEFTKQSLVQAQAALNAKEKECNTLLTSTAERLADVQNNLAAETSRANAAEAFAKARRKGLADVAAVINPLLAAE